ncbi:hypothetical protein ACPUEN_00890 [Algoriphagus yeomjeoni]|uniref:hypothetical protein n=1 Tax=Algoriphagus yeomjeoni TaxID=291403 RepID=UPI003CE51701
MTTTGWADYVFKPEYSFIPISEQDTLIEKNGRLRNVPKEADVLDNGVNLLKMNVNLLEKIEGLTLYIFYQSKEIETIKSKLDL